MLVGYREELSVNEIWELNEYLGCLRQIPAQQILLQQKHLKQTCFIILVNDP